MKKLYRILTFGAALAAMVSCDLNKAPKFEDCKEAFAAFDVSSITVNEDAGSISIPVTVASLDPRTVAVAYLATDGKAKAGEHYELTDDKAVLQFDGKERTMNLVIDIKNLAGEYTGDVDFSVSIVSAGDLKIGANNTCSVKILDLDHPLASILGSYTANAGYYTGTPCSWPVTLDKDPEDVSVVWIDFPVYMAYSLKSWGSWSVYGTVSEDLKTITIPCGQTPGDSSGKPAWNEDESDVFVLGLWENVGGGNVNLTTAGSLTMTLNDEGVWVTEDAPAVWTISGNFLYADCLITKGTMTWTKN